MPLFQYEAFDKKGAKVSGVIDATSLQTAREMLRERGILPFTIREVSGEKSQDFFSAFFEKKITNKEVVLFTRQLAVLLKSAIPLLQAIELLTEQFEGGFKRTLFSIKDGLKAGESFAKELARYPKIFSNVYIQLVKAGEASGKLDQILVRLAEYLERSEAVKKSIKKALSYPIMLLCFSIGVLVAMLTLLVPRLRGMFEKMGSKGLPGPTKLLIAMSDFMINHFMVLAMGVFGLVIFFLYWKSTEKGKMQFDKVLLSIGFTAYFSQTKAVVQFSKTLGMLLESGVNLSEALEIVCNIVENKVLTQKLKFAQDKIIKEGKIAKYLKETNMFPNIASYMISTGEQSGKLAEMLLVVGNDYDEELKEITESMTSKIAPIMTIFMGLMIGFMILSIILPIMDMSNLAGK